MAATGMKNRRTAKRVIAVLICSLLLPPPTQAATDDMAAVMYRMMLLMASVMSNAMLGSTGSRGGGNYFGTPGQSYGAPWGMNPWDGYASPWHGYGAPWGSYGYAPWEDTRDWQEIPPPSSTSSSVEGRWISATGEVLEIYGDRFRLGTPDVNIVGMLRVEGNIITMYSPQTNTTTRYRFLLNKAQLVLNSGGDKLLVFRRHPHDAYSGY